MKKRLLRITLSLSVAGLILLPLWHYQATKREESLKLYVPHWVAPAFAKYYGEGPVTQRPSKDTAVVGLYSIVIHKSQIHPWGTVWRKNVYLTWDKDDWQWAGESNFPSSITSDLKVTITP